MADPRIKFIWTHDNTAQAIKNYRDGLSMRENANAIGNPSRHSVIGRLHRIGAIDPSLSAALHRSHSGDWRPKADRKAPRSPKPTKAARQFQHGSGCVVELKSRDPKPTDIAGPTAMSKNLRIADPGFGGCRWPTGGDGANTTFCCVTTGDAIYCPTHARIAYQPMPAKGPRSPAKELARSLRRYA